MVNASEEDSHASLLASRFASCLLRRRSPTPNAASCATSSSRRRRAPDKYVDTFSFRRNHRADSVLMLVKNTIEKGQLPNAGCSCIATTRSRPRYCVVEPRRRPSASIEDMPENASGDNFGPPGSGLPRCATRQQGLHRRRSSCATGPTANSDRAASSIPPRRTASGFQFLITDDQDWIIIEDDKRPDPASSTAAPT